MEPIIIRFEANCPCLWRWDSEYRCLAGTDVYDGCSPISRDLWDDQTICDACFPLEEEYDETCFNEHGAFEPHGWKSEAQMKAFNQKMINLWEFLREHLKGKYEVYIHGFYSDPNDSLNDSSKEPVL